MRTASKSLLILAMVVLLAAPLAAQDKKKKKNRKKGRNRGAVAQMMQRLKKAELTEEQTAKIKKIAAEHGPKIAAGQKKINELLTPEQRKAGAAARRKAQKEGKKGRELAQAVAAALNLSDDVKAKRAALQKEQRACVQAFQKAVIAVLTPEQRKAIRPQGKKGANKNKKKRKKKKDDS